METLLIIGRTGFLSSLILAILRKEKGHCDKSRRGIGFEGRSLGAESGKTHQFKIKGLTRPSTPFSTTLCCIKLNISS